MRRIVLHIDVNNAFLSWTAIDLLSKGYKVDIRKIHSIIGGDESRRAGIVLAKSELAKKCGVVTAETIYSAKRKCRNLEIFAPSYKLYEKCSNEMYDILKKYSDKIERYSIDECFLEYTEMITLYGDPFEAAIKIQKEIFDKLGFTVNVGIGNNKLLAKMASELEKPNKINSIYYKEIKEKLWKLPVAELFMVGRKTAPELYKMDIHTVKDLALTPKKELESKFKKYGTMLWNYANGIDDTEVNNQKHEYKGIGNSTTTGYDITNKEKAYEIILSLCENVAKRLRDEKMYTSCISVQLKNSSFLTISHQRKLTNKTNSTQEIYEISKDLLDEMWKGQPIRLFGVRLDCLSYNADMQLCLFSDKKSECDKKIDKAIDSLRNKFGDNSIKRAIFIRKD